MTRLLPILALTILPACPASRYEWRPVCREYAVLEAITAQNHNLPARIAVGLNRRGNPHATGEVLINDTWVSLDHDAWRVFVGQDELTEVWRYYSPSEWSSARRRYVGDCR